MESNGVDDLLNNATNLTNQKGEHLVIDLGSIDTRTLLTQGEKKTYVNRLSAREMDSLSALCETILPAVKPPQPTSNDSVLRFYRTSASMAGTPEHLGGMISERLGHHVFILRLFFFMLSTRIGTLLLAGGTTRSLSPRFPYLHNFSKLPIHTRQQIVQSWSTSFFFLLRMAFVGAKLLILLAFFTQVDENEENPSWEAIGYTGPDPDLKSKQKSRERQSSPNLAYLTPKTSFTHNKLENNEDQPKQINSKEEVYGPLYNGIINVKHPKHILAESLRAFGFHVSLNRKRKHNPQTPSMLIKCDAVVVGSGSGGGVVAGVLASAGYKVLVLEKGDYYARNNLTLLEGHTLDQMYEGAGMLLTRDLGVAILAGSTVGGGSTINWSASIKTPQHVRKEWSQEHELEIFDSPLFNEALDVVCAKMEVQNDIIFDEGFNNAVLRKGCLELGYPIENIPRNAPANHYCGWCSLGCKDGKKKGTCETWLKDMVESRNGVVLSGCEVKKVLYKRKAGRNRDTATGVMFELVNDSNKKLGCEWCVIEAKETIIACGALNTPALLKRSGLKNPNIGKNLHLHPVVMAWGYFPDNEESICPGKKSYEGAIMSAMSTVVGNFNNSGYGAVIQTPSLHPGIYSALMPWTSGSDMKHRMLRFSRTAHMFALARDVGSGSISDSPFDITYKMETVDESHLKQGVEKMLRILAAAGAEEIGTHHISGASINVKKVSCHEFEKFVKRESSREIKGLKVPVASAHQMGSCKMGKDPKRSVVNERGESWDVEGLYIADASVFPSALGVNPMVTIQAIAYCTSQSILESLKRKNTTRGYSKSQG